MELYANSSFVQDGDEAYTPFNLVLSMLAAVLSIILFYKISTADEENENGENLFHPHPQPQPPPPIPPQIHVDFHLAGEEEDEEDEGDDLVRLEHVVVLPGRSKGEVCQSILRTLGFAGVYDRETMLHEIDVDQVRGFHRNVLVKRCQSIWRMYGIDRVPEYLFEPVWSRKQYFYFINTILNKHNLKVYAAGHNRHAPYKLKKSDPGRPIRAY